MKSNNLNIHTSSVHYVRPNVIRRFVHPYIVISNSGGIIRNRDFQGVPLFPFK